MFVSVINVCFPSQMFSSVGEFRNRICIYFLNSGDFFLIFRFRNKFTNNNNNHQISLLGSSTRWLITTSIEGCC